MLLLRILCIYFLLSNFLYAYDLLVIENKIRGGISGQIEDIFGKFWQKEIGIEKSSRKK